MGGVECALLYKCFSGFLQPLPLKSAVSIPVRPTMRGSPAVHPAVPTLLTPAPLPLSSLQERDQHRAQQQAGVGPAAGPGPGAGGDATAAAAAGSAGGLAGVAARGPPPALHVRRGLDRDEVRHQGEGDFTYLFSRGEGRRSRLGSGRGLIETR